MQPTISIPKGWEYPRFTLGQRTQQGLIIGMEYKPVNTQLAYQYGHGWRYTVLPDKKSDEIHHYCDDEIQTLSVVQIQAQLQAEIEEHQQQIKVLQQQLAAITGGSADG
ncbi:hypothetical protein H6G94_34725 [Nostoc punctiforme FACHB-252]|uniref:Uncharacterized protein n=1 Tax=Nostoc punctiforme FACHB-252 TaxID=1357509 RepID=A0ABR8HKD6_NOSPU|nr:hypothetical protein [Nostoc punctiforme]MBD2616331.1 hypothetical protein [Nostoc punctiforme FACHB-252]